MTEELNEQVVREEKKCNCICCSEGFRDFLKIALGSFVGVFCALSLFAALHKPPFPPMMHHRMMVPPMPCHQSFKPMKHGDFHRVKVERRNFDKDIPVRVETEK